jgi:CubicO group peptidase (beta-lactamase class C family)
MTPRSRLAPLLPALLVALPHAQARAQTPPAGVDRSRVVAAIDSLVGAAMTTTKTPGMSVVVVEGSDTILIRGYGLADVENDVPVTPETVFRIGSVTKQFTSAAIMRLVEQNKVRLDAPLSTYLPEYAGPGRNVTVHHLLNHTSGIPSYTGLGTRWTSQMSMSVPHEQMLAFFAADSLEFQPGDKFAYNNSGYYLLGMIIERVSGEPYAQHVRRALTAPLGLASTLYCTERPIVRHRAAGYALRGDTLVNDEPFAMDQAFAAGALCSTPRDLVRWARALSGGQVVTAASYTRMTTPAALTGGGRQTYGYGLAASEMAGRKKVAHSGGISGFAAQLAHYPAEDLVVAVLANQEGANVGQLEAQIARRVLGIPEPKLRDLPLTAALRAGYAGTYRGTKGLTLQVVERGGALVMAPLGRLLHQGDHTFIAEGVPDAQIVFRMQGARANALRATVAGTTIDAERAP